MKVKYTINDYLSNYDVSEYGHVYSVGFNWSGYGSRELHQSLNSDGYQSVRLTFKGLRKRYAVHVLVAHVFIGNRPEGKQLRHLDGNKLNNVVSNLRYGRAKQNADDREYHGRTSRGNKHSLKIKEGIYGTK